MRRLRRAAIGAAAALLLAGLLVPLVHANRFRNRIRTALESALGGRRVEIGDVGLRLLPAPGFHLENVVLGDDPAFGAEHFAYMTALDARLRLRALWTGRIEMASLTLVEPSLNLVKNEQGRWNFEALLGRAGAAQTYFPYIGIEDGRVNFKFGATKSIFYVQDAEAALAPPRDAGGRWRLRFAGRPARAGRLLSGMGLIRGDGYLSAATEPSVSFEIELERSPIGHLLTLARGRDFGVHGMLAARAVLRGPLARVRLEGSLRADDVHRWDILPLEGGLTVPLEGTLDLLGQRLALSSSLRGEKAGGARGRFELRDYLSAPRWTASVDLERVAVGPLFQAARRLGAALPSGIEARGWLGGELRFAGAAWPEGALEVTEGALVRDAAPAIELSALEARLDGARFEIAPFQARVGGEQIEAAASGQLDAFRFESRLSARGLRLAGLTRAAEMLQIRWLHALESGQWDGQLVWQKTAGRPGVWSGAGVLANASWRPEGFQSPVSITKARVKWEGATLQLDGLSGSLGEMRFAGSYRRRPEGADSCNLRLTSIDVQGLDPWLKPERKTSRWALWRRVLGRSAPEASSWLRTARVEGPVRVDELRLGSWTFRNVRSDVAWNGERLLLRRAQAEVGGGSFSGSLDAEFAGEAPRYRLRASVDGVSLAELAMLPENFRRGTLAGVLDLEAAGRTAADLRAGLKAAGEFEGRGITLEGVAREDADGHSDGSLEIRLLRGKFELAHGELDLSGLRMALGRENYEGRGTIGGRPRILFELAADGKPLRLVDEARAATPE